MYCMFEHCYYTREKDAQRTVFAFTPVVAPTKATVFPLVQKPEMTRVAKEVSATLRRAGVSNIIDTTGEHLPTLFSRAEQVISLLRIIWSGREWVCVGGGGSTFTFQTRVSLELRILQSSVYMQNAYRK
jgi:hypothetical protein